MSVSQPKYNPGILGDEQLIRGFVARQSQLQAVLQHLRENAASTGANQHVLIVGPRGSGKTTLVRRAAAEVRRDTDLSTHWHPIVFGEESYQVSTPGEFWLEALFHVAEENHDQRWLKTVDDLKAESDDVRLRERALGQLLDFADERHSRLLLVVENLNMLLGEQMREHGDWELRHTLQTEPRLMLLGTATSRFTEVSNIDEAWFELFTIHDLAPLNLDECAQVWELITGTRPVRERIRAVQILTAGNPRLLRIMAEFVIGRSFRELLGQLVQLVDEHTEYFKSHLDVLPAAERKVFVALLEQWNAVEAREVAQAARIQVSPASALLNRLVQRGAVEVVEHRRRKKLYQAAERLYNIYYLMRRRGHPSSRVQAAVDFMVHFYQGEELVEAVTRLAGEALQLTPDLRKDHYVAYSEILRRGFDPSIHHEILKQTPSEFLLGFARRDTTSELCNLPLSEELLKSVATAALNTSLELLQQGNLTEAVAACCDAIARDGNLFDAWVLLSSILHKSDRVSEAAQALRKALSIKPDSAPEWVLLGSFGEKLHSSADAEQSYRMAIQIDPNHARAWFVLGLLMLEGKRWQDAEHAFREYFRVKSDSAYVWMGLGIAFVGQMRLGEAQSASI